MSDTAFDMIPDLPPIIPVKFARSLSDAMALWALCEQRACRKRGQCQANRPTCLDACAPFAPDSVAVFAVTLFAGKYENLGFDDALARIPEDVREDWVAWHKAVTRMTGRPSMPPLRQQPAS